MLRIWLRLASWLVLIVVLSACAPKRSFERAGDGSVVYFDMLDVEDRARARSTVVQGIRRGLESYRFGTGDTMDLLFHFSQAPLAEDYAIAVGDELTIEFLYDPDNNRTVKVRPDGRISMPLIGPIAVAGLSADELAQQLQDRYEGIFSRPVVTVNLSEFRTPLDDFEDAVRSVQGGRSRQLTVGPDGKVSPPLLDPVRARDRTVEELRTDIDAAYARARLNITVSVLPLTIEANRIMVFGEVRDPGPLVVDRPQTVLMAIASAGGVLPSGSMESVYVFYVGEDMQPRIRAVNLLNILEDLRIEEDIVVPDNSVIYVPPTELAKAGRFLDATLRDILRYNGIGANFGINYILDSN